MMSFRVGDLVKTQTDILPGCLTGSIGRVVRVAENMIYLDWLAFKSMTDCSLHLSHGLNRAAYFASAFELHRQKFKTGDIVVLNRDVDTMRTGSHGKIIEYAYLGPEEYVRVDWIGINGTPTIGTLFSEKSLQLKPVEEVNQSIPRLNEKYASPGVTSTPPRRFRIGDRVVLQSNIEYGRKIAASIGAIGTVRGYIESISGRELVDIRWDRNELSKDQMNGGYTEELFELETPVEITLMEQKLKRLSDTPRKPDFLAATSAVIEAMKKDG